MSAAENHRCSPLPGLFQHIVGHQQVIRIGLLSLISRTIIPLRVRLDSRKWYSDALRTASQQRVPANPSTPFFSGYCAP
jgi:hypothetical protein